MEDFEKLGAFYLGRPYDLGTKQPKEGVLLYDSKDLLTHAMCVGMTGSGKTGLCLALLEEAAIDSIPAIIIDPKGDLANLLLTFPDFKGDDFAPWINEEDAEQKGVSPAEFAAQQAETWKKGLAGWGQDGERVKRLRNTADFRIYTPASNAGIPVSILKSFSAPPDEIVEDNELLRERISTTAASLLGLLGIDADPLKSQEHILISNLLSRAWSAGEDLDIAGLIQQIQSPPMTKIGAMDLDSVFPPKERNELAVSLNNLLAAPGFATWMEGEPLDIQQILYTPEGKPRLAIFSIAHLSDAERMFFVSLLLNQVLGWMRTQSGTSSLRALLYMDEIFGYFPPVANPPSKLPLMTLLKQARAFGLGVVLVTQNPVDLDYKGLGNIGTWFIGRLQTDRDKERVLGGLEGVAAGTGTKFDRQQMEQTLAALGNRVFLLNNVHDDGPEIFESRWAMSYLRGPLTRKQIKSLMDPIKKQGGETAATATAGAATPGANASPAATVKGNAVSNTGGSSQPILPQEVIQYFIPLRNNAEGQELVYQPAILGAAEVHFSNKLVDLSRQLMMLTGISDGVVSVNWDDAAAIELALDDLEKTPEENAQFLELPGPAAKVKSYSKWQKDLAAWLYRSQRLELFTSPSLKQTSKPEESERDFRIRLQQAAREKRDEAAERLRQKYAPKIAALEERKRRALQAVEREAEQARGAKMQTAISFGATLLSSFMGRKAVSMSSMSRATSAARGVGRSYKESQDVGRAEETVAAVEEQLAQLDAEFKSETETLAQSGDPQTEALDSVLVKPTKTNITISLLSLAWAPYWRDAQGQTTPAWE